MRPILAGRASAITPDGKVVVGDVFRWFNTPYSSEVPEDLYATYRSYIPHGRISSVHAISPNKRYIVGYGPWGGAPGAEGASPRGFFLDTGCFYPVIEGDVNRDGVVDDSDLLRILFAFGSFGLLDEDLNGDEVVDDADLLIVLFNFGSQCER